MPEYFVKVTIETIHYVAVAADTEEDAIDEAIDLIPDDEPPDDVTHYGQVLENVDPISRMTLRNRRKRAERDAVAIGR